MRHFLLISTALGFLTGCGTIPGAEKFTPVATEVVADIPVTETGDWAEYAPDSLPQTDWVAGFGDSILPALIDEALEQNTDIRAAAARYDRALTQLKSAQADRLPTISGSINSSRTQPFGTSVFTTAQGVDVTLGGATANIALGLAGSWEADLWGRIKDSINSSELSASATAADLAATRLLSLIHI